MSQWAHFDLSSETVTAAQITARLGMEPDEIRVRGARRLTPTVVPRAHSWSIQCRNADLRVDELAEVLLARLVPVREKVRNLVDVDDVSACLSFFRSFNDEEGEEEHLDAAITKDGQLLERIGGQHQLLGWHLEVEQLEFLVSIRAEIDCDEYG